EYGASAVAGAAGGACAKAVGASATAKRARASVRFIEWLRKWASPPPEVLWRRSGSVDRGDLLRRKARKVPAVRPLVLTAACRESRRAGSPLRPIGAARPARAGRCRRGGRSPRRTERSARS